MTRVNDTDPVSPSALAVVTALGWISTAGLAGMLGRASARSALQWCKRHDIPITRDGKWNFVRLDAVRAVLERLAGQGNPEHNASMADGLHKVFG